MGWYDSVSGLRRFENNQTVDIIQDLEKLPPRNLFEGPNSQALFVCRSFDFPTFRAVFLSLFICGKKGRKDKDTAVLVWPILRSMTDTYSSTCMTLVLEDHTCIKAHIPAVILFTFPYVAPHKARLL